MMLAFICSATLVAIWGGIREVNARLSAAERTKLARFPAV
jgi:hypothetical protein